MDPLGLIFGIYDRMKANENAAGYNEMLSDYQKATSPEDIQFIQRSIPDYGINDPSTAYRAYNEAAPTLEQLQNRQAREASPILAKYALGYQDIAGPSLRFLADPESRAELVKSGMKLPTSEEMQNPYVQQGMYQTLNQAQHESDLTDVASSLNKGTPASSEVLARYLMNGGDKSTAQMNTLQTYAKNNDEIAKLRGVLTMMQAAGKAGYGDSPQLNALYANAQYGATPENVDKLANTLGLIKKYEAVDTGTGQGDIRQKMAWDPRSNQTAGRIGGTWDPKVANQIVNVGVKAYESELGKLTAKDVMDMRAAAKASRSKLDALDAIEMLAGNLNTGRLTDLGINVAQVGASFGLNLDPNLSTKEASRAIMGKLALEARNPAGGAGMPGSLSDSDRQFLVSTITPSLQQSKEGRSLLIGTTRKLEQRSLDVNTKAEAYIKKYGKLDDGFYRQLSIWSKSNPLFPRQR